MRWILFLLPLLFCHLSFGAVPNPWARRTVLIVNEAVPGSADVATFYQELRGIPAENIVTINTRETEAITREGYVKDIYNPILHQLLERELLKGELLDDVTPDGRERAFILSSQVRYLVPTFGVPYKILDDPQYRDPEQLKAFFNRYGNGAEAPVFAGTQLDVTRASVDSELTTMLLDGAPLAGVLPNPLFRSDMALESSAEPFFRVVRIDGPSPVEIKDYLRRGVEAEEAGLVGVAAFDRDQRGGAFKMGNDWIQGAQNVAAQADFMIFANHDREVFPLDYLLPPVALYFGWYADDVTGMFEQPDFQFAPGAVVAHLHSFSAQALRNPNSKWVGPLLRRGASAVVGNTAEPFLHYTHNFDALMEALARGATFGDAAYYAYPVLSWQGVAIGDPLYRPFAVSLEKQVAAVDSKSRRDWNYTDGLVLLREANRLHRIDENRDAIHLARRVADSVPHPMLTHALALLAEQVGDDDAAEDILDEVNPRRDFEGARPLDWLVYARHTTRIGMDRKAIEAFDRALPGIHHQELRRIALADALAAARKFGDDEAVRRFQRMQ
ncbi:MAG: hypothetical protein E1N59_2292 [Puniceicoccaceae bacterium 5H]|nr:MAG: hypothetical protein E1N59_2292 [Puniceicoccaceae bacterium 5H]